jgi:hypothetical protein
LSPGQTRVARIAGSRVHLGNSHRSPLLRFRDRARAEPTVDHLLKAERTQTIVERLLDPIHLLLGDPHLRTPTAVLTAGKDLTAASAHL